MSVYIPGMEMPEMRQAYAGLIICWNGEVFPFIPPQGYELGESVATAVSVPDHGRLIDADDEAFPTPHRNPSNDYMHGWNACLRSVQQQPTIIPASGGFEHLKAEAEVGEWIPLGHQIGYLKHPWSEDFKCPFCGYEQYTLMREPPNRCPKCWASLKLKKENEAEDAEEGE